MDQTQCREKLGNLIKDESLALNELSILLDREHGFLESADVASLESATRERQRCVARIFRVDEERRALCRDQAAMRREVLRQRLRQVPDVGGQLAVRQIVDAAGETRDTHDTRDTPETRDEGEMIGIVSGSAGRWPIQSFASSTLRPGSARCAWRTRTRGRR